MDLKVCDDGCMYVLWTADKPLTAFPPASQLQWTLEMVKEAKAQGKRIAMFSHHQVGERGRSIEGIEVLVNVGGREVELISLKRRLK